MDDKIGNNPCQFFEAYCAGSEPYFSDNPKIHFSLNLDQQEIEYETTFEIMKNISQENRSRLILEITEIPTLRRYGQYGETINVLAFKRLKKLGYRLALDDLTTGNNSLGNL